MNSDVIIVGGGPAGLSAALFAKAKGKSVLLLEHNEKLGKKLYITGKGRCNVSNLCDVEEFLKQVPRNPRFLYASLHFLPPSKLRDWLFSLGCPTVVERGRRVFPESQKASDVTKALASGLKPEEIRLHSEVTSLMMEEGRIIGVKLASGEEIRAKAVVLATGGLSYPVTGSTGIGHMLAGEAGHTVTPLSPSLTGFNTKDQWPKALQGLSLKNVALHASWPKKNRYSEQGELLFTHFGISGPLTLSLSSLLAGADVTEAEVFLDLKPALDHATLTNRLSNDIVSSGKKTVSGLMPSYLPSSLAALFPELIEVDGGKVLNQLSAKERERIITGLKQLPLRLESHRAFNEAVVTRGGVCVKEVNPKTLESKLVQGLYFAGEILDVDALTGGYNLQIAFSTGALAGASAANNLDQRPE